MSKSSAKGLYTMIGEGSTVDGTVSIPHSIRIDGTLKGSLSTDETLTVGATGIVEADIKAKSAIIGGKVIGNVVVEDRIELESNAVLKGDLVARDLVINEGATFHGNCSMNADEDVKKI